MDNIEAFFHELGEGVVVIEYYILLILIIFALWLLFRSMKQLEKERRWWGRFIVVCIGGSLVLYTLLWHFFYDELNLNRWWTNASLAILLVIIACFGMKIHIFQFFRTLIGNLSMLIRSIQKRKRS